MNNNIIIVKLDEINISKEVLLQKMELSKKDKSFKIIEVSPGIYKTLRKLNS